MSISDEGSVAISDDDLDRQVRLVLENVELVNVRVTSCSARLLQVHVQPASRAAVSVETEYFVDAGAMANRYRYAIEVWDSDDDALAEIQFDIVIDFDVAEGFEPGTAAAQAFAVSTGYFAAFPYAREITESLSARLQLDPLVLGLLRRGSEVPGTVTAVVRRPGSP